MQNWDRQCLIAQSCKGGRIIFGPIGEESTKLPLRQQHPAVLFEYSDLAVENHYAPLHGFGQVNHDLGYDLVVGAYKPLINTTFRLAENVRPTAVWKQILKSARSSSGLRTRKHDPWHA